MRCFGLVPYLLLVLLVIMSSDAVVTDHAGPPLEARASSSESSSSSKSRHGGVRHSASNYRTVPPRSPLHSSQSTQLHPGQASHAHTGSVSASSVESTQKQTGQLGHLVASLRPGSRSKIYKQQPKVPWWKQHGGQPARSRGKSPSSQASHTQETHPGSAGGSSSAEPKGKQVVKLGHLAASARPGARPTNVKQDRKVPWWKQAGGQPRRIPGTSPEYEHHKLYRERKKLRKELQELLDQPSELFEKPPPGKKGGGPGSPGAGGFGHAISKRQRAG